MSCCAPGWSGSAEGDGLTDPGPPPTHTGPVSPQIEIRTDAGAMPAQLWLPEGGEGPGILLLQEIFGISPYLRRRAEDLAALGYVVLAPEVFWRLGVRAVPDGPGMLGEAVELLGRLDWDAAVADSTAALGALRTLPAVTGPVGVVGFCFGGGLGYAVVAGEPADGLVSYYGSALPTLVEHVPSVSTPSLHHFGDSDAYLPEDVVDRVSASVTSGGAPTEVHTHPGADHAFDNPDFVNFDAVASRDAWAATEEWLRRTLPVR